MINFVDPFAGTTIPASSVHQTNVPSSNIPEVNISETTLGGAGQAQNGRIESDSSDSSWGRRESWVNTPYAESSFPKRSEAKSRDDEARCQLIRDEIRGTPSALSVFQYSH